ncbi:hypothetical protein EWB00_002360 [Schistosoma japonicum]|uniref:Uncharacterized protein n=1 Tax=Schistosoma japonicum TaxID=6182 RepID=A0A4Z2DCB3_SCHJA|nr:hypothetical protein EWB00_002360 [Schistosoma japonicum]
MLDITQMGSMTDSDDFNGDKLSPRGVIVELILKLSAANMCQTSKVKFMIKVVAPCNGTTTNKIIK